MCIRSFHDAGGTAEARDHAREALRRRAARDRTREGGTCRLRILRKPAEQQHFLPQRQRDFEQPRVGRLAAKQRDRLANFERIAGRTRERLGHVGQQRAHRQARAGGRRRHRLRQLAATFGLRQDRAVAELDVEHEPLKPCGQLLRENGGNDQGQAVHGRRDVADRVKAPVGRRDAIAGADDRDAGLAHGAAHAIGRRPRLVTRNRLELVERAAGVREPAADDHRDASPAGREHRPERERDEVADAAGGMLVEHRAGQRLGAPVEDLAAVAHRQREGRALRGAHAAVIDGHRERADLRVGKAPVADSKRDPREIARVERPAVALDADRFLRQPGHGAFGSGSSKA